jgi:hypothetical protein
MGFILKKSNKCVDVSIKSEKVKVTFDENKLYKPISEFKWKDASPAEVHQEAIPHYGKRFAL